MMSPDVLKQFEYLLHEPETRVCIGMLAGLIFGAVAGIKNWQTTRREMLAGNLKPETVIRDTNGMQYLQMACIAIGVGTGVIFDKPIEGFALAGATYIGILCNYLIFRNAETIAAGNGNDAPVQ